MVTRRNLLVGSAAMLGALGVGTGPAAAAGPRSAISQRQRAFGMPLPGGLVCPVEYVTRAGWGANESWRSSNPGGYWAPEYYPVQTLTVHHSGAFVDPDPTATIRGIYNYQCNTLAWGDIGYQLLIDAAGVVYEGRWSGEDQRPVFGSTGLMVTGAHVGGYNSGNVGICLLGWLSDGHDGEPTAAAWSSLVTVLAYLAVVGGVNPTANVNFVNPVSGASATVRGVCSHRNWPGHSSTECPGNSFYPMLGLLRQGVAAAMSSVPASDPSPSPSASASPSGEPAPSSSPSAEPSASASASASSEPTSSASPSPPATGQTGSGGRGRGESRGDEYVPVARTESPNVYPTVRPSATPAASSSPSGVATSVVPPTRPQLAAPPPAVEHGGSATLTITAAAVGATAAAAVGGWLLRRRLTVAAGTASARPEPAADPSPTDDSTAISTVDDTTTGEQPGE